MNGQRARPITLPRLVSILCALSLVPLSAGAAAATSGPAALDVAPTSGFVTRDEGGSGSPPSEPSAASQRYTFRSTLDFAAGELATHQTLEWTNSGSQAVSFIDLSVLPRALDIFTLDSASVDGQPTEPAWTTTTNMRLTFPEPVQPAQTARIDISFTLAIGASRGGFRDRLARKNGVVNFGNWFPIWSREHDIYGIGDPQLSYNADSMRLELSATTDLGADAVASSGSRVSASANRWIFEASNVRDFAFAVSPNFKLDSGSVTCREDGETYTTRVIAYAVSVSAATIRSKATAALRKFNSWYGCYRSPTLSLAEAAAVEGAEYPTMMFLDPVWATNSYIVYHEVAHQWWYSMVGNDQLEEPWIDEAWAQFSASYGLRVPFSSCSRHKIDRAATSWPAGPTSGAWYGPQSYIETVYFRGAEFLNELRLRMGNRAFFATARRFIANHRYEVVTGEQMLAAMQAGTSANLRPIIEKYTGYSEPGAGQSAAALFAGTGPDQRRAPGVLAGLEGHCP